MSNEFDSWHYARPDLAKSYLGLFKLGLTSARSLFARRRMGKTEFLKKDLLPAAKGEGYIAVYVNLWDLTNDPATAIISELYKAIEPKGFNKILSSIKPKINKVSAKGKVPLFLEGAVEAELLSANKIPATMLMEAMAAFDKKKKKLMLVIDEAQVLAYQENTVFAKALRSALDIRKNLIKVIFAGSSETTLRRMFGVASEPFYNWAPLEPFELLGDEFVIFMVERVNQICKYPLLLEDAKLAFKEFKATPEFFRRYIEQYLNNPLSGTDSALKATKLKLFNDDGFKSQWDNLLEADKVILSFISNGGNSLFKTENLETLGRFLGKDKKLYKNAVANTLRRLNDQNILTKIAYGEYQFEDQAFEDWVRYNYKF